MIKYFVKGKVKVDSRKLDKIRNEIREFIVGRYSVETTDEGATYFIVNGYVELKGKNEDKNGLVELFEYYNEVTNTKAIGEFVIIDFTESNVEARYERYTEDGVIVRNLVSDYFNNELAKSKDHSSVSAN